jgi:Na+-driven multidrug efflux pump
MRASIAPRNEIAGELHVMIHEVHVSVRIALFQFVVVILGVLMTRAFFMGAGYPETPRDWSAVALLVRNHGYVLMLVPVVWTVATLYFENYGSGTWSRRWTVVSGVLLLVALAFLFLWTCGNPYSGRSDR